MREAAGWAEGLPLPSAQISCTGASSIKITKGERSITKFCFLFLVQHQDQYYHLALIYFQLLSHSSLSPPLLSSPSTLMSSMAPITAGRKGSRRPTELPSKKPFFFPLGTCSILFSDLAKPAEPT